MTRFMHQWPARVVSREEMRDMEDPWVMYLVVDETHPRASDAHALAIDAVRCALTVHCDDDPQAEEALAAWWETSFRKVTLRLKGAKHQQLDEFAGAREGAMWVSVPMRRSEAPALIRKAQVFRDPKEPAPVEAETDPAWLFSVLCEMSSGKRIAQVTHAALLLARDVHADPKEAREWPMAFTEQTPPATATIVRDAGLTEVDPYTATIAAWEAS